MVHRADLQTQWHERLQAFLNITSNSIGRIGGGYKNATGVIDIAVVQSLVSKGHVNDLVEQYGQVIIDECHHVGAQSFEAILKRVKARFVMGLTATPERQDGQQPIIYMQCGPIRHRAKRESNSDMAMIVRPHHRHNPISIAVDSGIQQVFLQLTKDSDRTEGIAKMALQYLGEGRKVLVLTERTDHIESLRTLLPDESAVYMLHGRIPKKTRANTLRELNSLAEHEPRLLLATGKLIGEGFDHAALDVLILAMPVSWKGTLQQYVGRLHRTHQSKSAVTVVDIVDWGHPALIRMWQKRQRGYLAMGYEIADKSAASPAQLSILPN